MCEVKSIPQDRAWAIKQLGRIEDDLCAISYFLDINSPDVLHTPELAKGMIDATNEEVSAAKNVLAKWDG